MQGGRGRERASRRRNSIRHRPLKRPEPRKGGRRKAEEKKGGGILCSHVSPSTLHISERNVLENKKIRGRRRRNKGKLDRMAWLCGGGSFGVSKKRPPQVRHFLLHSNRMRG
ncbi:hypothetical protein CAOG_009468 [Capsaspora owczarzaki ATCC 30864]|uniref:Uncharacterized protein n=1 Tax=Capsaspora owczarzaki (strain ATCC 30864) TaxID=595528 RepID=A0A0D2WL78_CAPO3|nr:hypothetical protein CAOG_009468 [Capsaspora owczarzaki ATCC 30864]